MPFPRAAGIEGYTSLGGHCDVAGATSIDCNWRKEFCCVWTECVEQTAGSYACYDWD